MAFNNDIQSVSNHITVRVRRKFDHALLESSVKVCHIKSLCRECVDGSGEKTCAFFLCHRGFESCNSNYLNDAREAIHYTIVVYSLVCRIVFLAYEILIADSAIYIGCLRMTSPLKIRRYLD